MNKNSNQHVTPHKNGGWQVKGAGNSRATARTSTQAEAYQIAKAGIKVKLYEMKPIKYSEAHSNENLAEIVCSNSFKSNLLTTKKGSVKPYALRKFSTNSISSLLHRWSAARTKRMASALLK